MHSLEQKDGMHQLALHKENEVYVFYFTDETRRELFRTLGRYASNPELSFTWYDAAIASKKLRKEFCKE